MKSKHHTTRIFIGLFIITMLLTYIALTLTTLYNQDLANSILIASPKPREKPYIPPVVKALDSSNWPTYTDKTYPISFRFPTGWAVQSSTTKSKDYYDLSIKPTDKSANFHITISKIGFWGLDGLKQDPYTYGNLTGKSVNGNLIGIKSGEYYYTFDGSLNTKKAAEFKTLMSTVVLQ